MRTKRLWTKCSFYRVGGKLRFTIYDQRIQHDAQLVEVRLLDVSVDAAEGLPIREALRLALRAALDELADPDA